VREGCELWLRECNGRVSRGEMTRPTYAFYEVRARRSMLWRWLADQESKGSAVQPAE
jgi:hypothetical protein